MNHEIFGVTAPVLPLVAKPVVGLDLDNGGMGPGGPQLVWAATDGKKRKAQSKDAHLVSTAWGGDAFDGGVQGRPPQAGTEADVENVSLTPRLREEEQTCTDASSSEARAVLGYARLFPLALGPLSSRHRCHAYAGCGALARMQKGLVGSVGLIFIASNEVGIAVLMNFMVMAQPRRSF